MVAQRRLTQTLLIDNYDSYTYNLFQMLAQVNGLEPIVYYNDAFDGDWKRAFEEFNARVQEVQALHRHVDIHMNIVLSPGPGTPTKASDFGLCAAAIEECSSIPILGVCLGHQGMAYYYGGRVEPAPQVVHGQTSRIVHVDMDPLFHNIPTMFDVVRYHSLLATTLPTNKLTVLATTADDNLVMAFKHKEFPHYGVQFHPESVCSEYGYQLLQNFRDISCQAPCRPCDLHHEAYSTYSVPHLHKAIGSVGSNGYHTVIKKLDIYVDPEIVFEAFFGSSGHAFWLDSSNGNRFSFMGDTSGPLSKHIEYDKWLNQTTVHEDDMSITTSESILEYIRRELKQHTVTDSTDSWPFDFRGGFVGYFGYEVLGIDSKDDLKFHPPGDMRVPDASFIFADRVVVFDSKDRVAYLLAVSNENLDVSTQLWLEETARRISHTNSNPLQDKHESFTCPIVFTPSRTRATYEANIATILENIQAGETYEVCLTNQLIAELEIKQPLQFYKTLRKLNPAPYAGFLTTPNYSICSSSPERFISLDKHRNLESKPIKGTRKRCHEDPSVDAAIADELKSCTKDRAENMMITDLVRNDFGHVCAVGSIHVPKLMQVESYATVHQLVTTVRGYLRPECDVVDAIYSTFPGGSMTGAPKKRTMDIIRQIECHPRGVYSGSLGYLSLNGAADMNIIIRTAVVTKSHVTIGSGGAIVALSDTDDEYDEMLLKTKALRSAFELYCKQPVVVDVQSGFYT